MKKYFLYARKSSDSEDRQILSIEAQLVELKQFIQNKADKVNIVQEFTESRTAKEPGRPILNQMIAKLEKGEADGIFAWHPDRLARNSIDGGKIIHLVDKGLIKYLDFPTYRFDNTAQGKFMLNIIFGQSKYYVDNLSENVKRGIRQKLRRGEFPNRAPLGYINNLRTKGIEIDNQIAPLVKNLFETYSTGKYSLYKLMSYSSSIGLINKTNGASLCRSKIQYILSNSLYCGLINYNGEVFEGRHEPIVSRELFYKVQEIMKKKSKPIKTKHVFNFLNLIKCDVCGCMITAELQRGHAYYRCTKKRGHCDLGYIREENLVEQIDSHINKVVLSDIFIDQLKKNLEAEKISIEGNSKEELNNLNKTLDDLNLKINRLMDVYLDGTISKRELGSRKENLLNKKYQIQQEINKLEKGQYVWLEHLEEFINKLDKPKIVLKTANLQEKKKFLENIGSNIKLCVEKDKKSLELVSSGSEIIDSVPLSFGGGVGGEKSQNPSKCLKDSPGSRAAGGGKAKPKVKLKMEYQKFWAIVANAFIFNDTCSYYHNSTFRSIWLPELDSNQRPSD